MNKNYKLLIIVIILMLFFIIIFQFLNSPKIINDEIKFSDMKKIENFNDNYFEIYQLANLGQYAHGLTSSDFNKDSFIDFAVSYATDPFDYSMISIFYNIGNMSFVKEDIYKFNYSYIDDLDSGDYDNDDDIDFIFTYSEGAYHNGYNIKIREHVIMLINNGQGKYDKESTIAIRGSGDPEDLENRVNPRINSLDFDNDGDIDIVLGDNSGIVELFINTGNANFESYGIIDDFGNFSWGLSSNDFNSDGYIDLLISAYGNIDLDNDGYINIIYNKGSPQYFTQYSNITILENLGRQGYIGSIISFDYDGDNDFDIVYGKINSLYLLINNDGNFNLIKLGFLPKNSGNIEDLSLGGMASADFNCDGKQDFILGGVQGIIYVFINNFNK